jgi:hypothetical protein
VPAGFDCYPLLKGKLSIAFHDFVCVEHKIEAKIITIKVQRVMLDSDVAQFLPCTGATHHAI